MLTAIRGCWVISPLHSFDRVASAMAPFAPKSTSTLVRGSLTERIPCPASVLGLFAGRSGVNLEPLSASAVGTAHIPESNQEGVL